MAGGEKLVGSSWWSSRHSRSLALAIYTRTDRTGMVNVEELTLVVNEVFGGVASVEVTRRASGEYHSEISVQPLRGGAAPLHVKVSRYRDRTVDIHIGARFELNE